MEWVGTGRITEVFALRLDYGEDVQQCIEAFLHENGIRTGLIMSGIGTLSKARIHVISTTEFPSENLFLQFEGPIEVGQIQGLVADYEPHLHMTFYIHGEDRTYAGHVEPGCTVQCLLELAIAKLEGMELTRREHPERGTWLLTSASERRL